MGERKIRPGAIFLVVKEGFDSKALMKVQGVLEDGEVVVSHLGHRRPTALITNQAVIRYGGIVEGGRLGRFRFSGQPRKSSEVDG